MATFLMATLAVVTHAEDANASNTHTISGVSHGCGECSTSNDYYIHAFTDYPNSSLKSAEIYLNYVHQHTAKCYCTHAHRSWDTNPYAECRFETRHYSASPALNAHYHYAHNTNTGC